MNHRLSNAVLAVIAVLAALLMIGCTLALGEGMARADGLPVNLSQATAPPDAGTLVWPGQSASYPRQCGRHGYFTETSAYKWNGAALPGQHRTSHLHHGGGIGFRWGKVEFDGLTFYNDYRFPVIVAGWCS